MASQTLRCFPRLKRAVSVSLVSRYLSVFVAVPSSTLVVVPLPSAIRILVDLRIDSVETPPSCSPTSGSQRPPLFTSPCRAARNCASLAPSLCTGGRRETTPVFAGVASVLAEGVHFRPRLLLLLHLFLLRCCYCCCSLINFLVLQNGRSRVFCPVTKKRRRRLQGGFDAPFFDRRLSIIVGRLGAQRDSARVISEKGER